MILSVLSSAALVSGLMVARAKILVHSVLFSILVFRDTSVAFKCFSSLPLVKRMALDIQIFFFLILQFVSFFLFNRLAVSLGYVLMEDLSRAVSQFYPSTSGGMSGFPGTPSGPSSNNGGELILLAEPGPSENSTFSQEDLFSILEQPLLTDECREEELSSLLKDHYSCEIDSRDLKYEVDLHMKVEKSLETFLRRHGYTTTTITRCRSQMRSFILYTQKGHPRNVNQLTKYLKEMSTDFLTSTPFKDLLCARDKYKLSLYRPGDIFYSLYE